MNHELPPAVFVTGAYRSGTTLLEKLLHSHPNVCVGSQPFPVLYFLVKSKFYRSRGIERRYPLDHCFLETDYSAEEFHAFLDDYELERADIEDLFDRLGEYRKGLWTPEILGYRKLTAPGSFFEVFGQLRGFVGEIFPKPDLRLLGSKEILCEEYVPYLLGRGVRVALVIRDPRAVLASAVCGTHEEFTGEVRPTLYTIRVWRKSVAFALAYRNHPTCVVLRYEDLVADPAGSMDVIRQRFDLPDYPRDWLDGGIHTQRGELWAGNSSFGPLTAVTTRSAMSYRELLPKSAVAYVEACCGPEMDVLGYQRAESERPAADCIRDFREPFRVRHGAFEPGYSESPNRVAEEIERLERLSGPRLEVADARRWFLHERAYQLLANGATA